MSVFSENIFRSVYVFHKRQFMNIFMSAAIKAILLFFSTLGMGALIKQQLIYHIGYGTMMVLVLAVVISGYIASSHHQYNITTRSLSSSGIIHFSLKFILNCIVAAIIFIRYPACVMPALLFTGICTAGATTAGLYLSMRQAVGLLKVFVPMVFLLFCISIFMMFVPRFYYSTFGIFTSALGLVVYIAHGVLSIFNALHTYKNGYVINTNILAIQVYTTIWGIFIHIIQLLGDRKR